MIKIKFNDSDSFIEAIVSKDEHIATLKGTIPTNESGFKAYSHNDVLIGDYSDFKTIYRVLSDGVQFSNDGSIWVEPTRDVTITIVWDDAEDAEGLRPSDVGLAVNGVATIITEADNWVKVYPDIKESETVIVTSAENVDKYDKTINGTSVTYHHDYVDPTPTLEERVNDLEIAVCEIADSIA